ncbi:MAG: DNA internalization-related competence protein ComEC/Rec2 [Candidatus Hydrogenedentota bacterium]
MKRPLLWAAVAFIAGNLSGAFGLVPGMAAPLFLAAAGLLVVAALARYSGARAAGVLLLFSAAGAMLWNARHLGPPGDPLSRFASIQPDETVYTLEGRVEQPDIVLSGQDYAQFCLRVEHAAAAEWSADIAGGVVVRWSGPARPIFAGDRVRVRGPLQLDLARINIGTSSSEDYLRGRDIHAAMPVRGAVPVERLAPGGLLSPIRFASVLRQTLAERLARAVPPETLGFLLTVWVGDRRRVEQAAYDAYVQSGTAHILSVSGVHMAIVYVTGTWVLGLFIRERRARTAVIMLLMFLFAFMAGASVACLRAVVMIAIYLAAGLVGREPDTPTALGASAFLFTLQDPDVLFDGGFQLSFLSIASILIFSPPIGDRLGALPLWSREPIASGLAVQFLPLPIAIHLFHVVPWAGPFANLLVIPMLSVILWLAFATSALALIWAPAAALPGHALAPFVALIEWISERTASMAGAAQLTTPTPLAVAAWYGALVCLWIALTRTERRAWTIAAGAVCVVVAVVAWSPFTQPAEVHFLDVGQGDATFIRTPGGTNILIDGGDRSPYTRTNMGRHAVGPFLWSNHVRKLDAVIATHADGDHVGGLLYVVENFRVAALYIGPSGPDSELVRELLEACARRGVPVRPLVRGDAIPVRGALLDVLHPPADWPASSTDNNASLVFRLTWPGMSVVLPADAEAEAEKAIAANDCRADVLKVPHHGSATSSTPTFVDAVRPSIAIISAGRRSGNRFINGGVLRDYQARGIEAYRTDLSGGIRLRSTSGGYRVDTARALRGYVTAVHP